MKTKTVTTPMDEMSKILAAKMKAEYEVGVLTREVERQKGLIAGLERAIVLISKANNPVFRYAGSDDLALAK